MHDFDFSLQDDEVFAYGDYCTFLQKVWTCDNCNEQMIVSTVEKLQHQQQCLTDKQKGECSLLSIKKVTCFPIIMMKPIMAILYMFYKLQHEIVLKKGFLSTGSVQ